MMMLISHWLVPLLSPLTCKVNETLFLEDQIPLTKRNQRPTKRRDRVLCSTTVSKLSKRSHSGAPREVNLIKTSTSIASLATVVSNYENRLSREALELNQYNLTLKLNVWKEDPPKKLRIIMKVVKSMWMTLIWSSPPQWTRSEKLVFISISYQAVAQALPTSMPKRQSWTNQFLRLSSISKVRSILLMTLSITKINWLSIVTPQIMFLAAHTEPRNAPLFKKKVK